MYIVKPKCEERECRHFRGILQHDRKDPLSLYPVCAAFPRWPGIPEEIAYGRNLHLKPFPGDHGIQFQSKENKKGVKNDDGRN